MTRVLLTPAAGASQHQCQSWIHPSHWAVTNSKNPVEIARGGTVQPGTPFCENPWYKIALTALSVAVRRDHRGVDAHPL
jgi:hypothetical protein